VAKIFRVPFGVNADFIRQMTELTSLHILVYERRSRFFKQTVSVTSVSNFDATFLWAYVLICVFLFYLVFRVECVSFCLFLSVCSGVTTSEAPWGKHFQAPPTPTRNVKVIVICPTLEPKPPADWSQRKRILSRLLFLSQWQWDNMTTLKSAWRRAMMLFLVFQHKSRKTIRY